MVKGYVSSIESFGLVDGPGIRFVVFLGGCKLRCKYCHNPETWKMKEGNTTPMELASKIIRNKPYYKNGGGVTFSGGEPLLQSEFIIETCKILKKEGIHVAIDTAGVGNGNYEEILKYVDLVLLDIKHVDRDGYKSLTGMDMDESLKFIDVLNKTNVSVWIRQVIVPGIMDNDCYMDKLVNVVRGIKNVSRIDFLPFHKMAINKYEKLGLEYSFKDIEAMDKEKCNDLYDKFMKKYKGK